ncbi:MAG TPA: TonB-dependent receptor [Caulobacteraceae bacterium]|jgi:iron complex outermembrane receptor protein|nr:TonB-dependent receptor [Caulobacteraceae bacterium]
MRYRLLAGVLATSALALVIGSGTARAAEAQKVTQVETLVVTAERRSENIQAVPISIQAFTAKDIEALGIKSSIDIGAVTPNVDIALVAGPGNQPIITIRGIGLNDYDTNNAGPNGVYVDEVYLSSPASQSFQTFDLDRIEVLKGPQGTLYGRNTSGGAINFITAKPTDTLAGHLHVEYSSFNTVNIEGALSGPLAPGWDARIAFVKNNSEGYVHNLLNGAHENGTDNYGVRLMLQYHPNSNFKALFNIHGGQVDNHVTEYRHIGDLDPNTGAQCSVAQTYAGGCVDLFGYGTPKDFYSGSFNRPDNLKVNNLGAYLRLDYTLGAVTLTSLTAFEHNDKIHPEDSDASPNRLLEINFGVKNNTITQEFRATGQEGRLDWVAGAYYLHEDLKQNQPIFILLDADKFFGPGAGDGLAFQAFDRSDQKTDAYAVFAQADFALTDRLKVTLGGRYTKEDRHFAYLGQVQFQQGGMDHFGPIQTLADTTEALHNDAFNWRAALNYELAQGVRVYGSIATGFKSGDFNGSFLSLAPAEIALQLTPVKPEHVTAYEVGFKSSLLDNRLLFDAAAFYNRYNDLQVFVLVPPVAGGGGFPVNVLDNAQRAHTEGIEAQMVAKPIEGLTLSGQLGYLETRLDAFVPNKDPSQPDFTGRQLPVSPHLSLAGLADYRVSLGYGSVDFQFSATYKSRQFFDISNDPYTVQEGYWLENIRIAYDPPGGQWEFAGYVRNLSDRKYFLDEFDLTAPFGFIQGIVGTPRTFGVEADYRF